ncbi:hypothetical protein O6H91_02G025400 [Diphasiastrum complanatum]|uniref:Uncharacterized protein n=1 Tax=Diphasiastrum complanatum TaxID=34168 RepID=A0ACC2EDL3_DIPCM|nr:hypothetical protein O6H91_02G025400 [Diphasiastrum complanatum]
MAFILEFAEHWIRRSMEDPEERDMKFRKHLQDTAEKCERNKRMWQQPVKPFGYWNTDKHNHKFLMDIKLTHLPGRTDPYDDVRSSSDRSSS